MGELGTLKNGMNFSKEAMGVGFPFVNLQNIFGNNVINANDLGLAMASEAQLKDYNLLEGDVLFVRSSVKLEGVGEAALVPISLENTTYSGFIIRFRDKYGLDKNFKRFIFCIDSIRSRIMSQATNSANKNISQFVLKNLDLKIPCKNEQVKIGEYFSNLDCLITLHQRKIIFYAHFYTIVWEQRKLFDIANKVTEKNKNNEFSEPFTNSAEQGIVSQREYFDREIVNNENLDGYYIVRNNDFIYNPRISVTAPVGPINRNRLGRNGVMSPLYTIFRTHNIDNLFLEFYFKTTSWHRYMKLNGDSGARFDRFTISSVQFMKMPIPYPMLAEQKKIGEYLDNLDHLITLHQWKCRFLVENEVNDWEQRKVSELADDIYGGGTPKTSVEEYWNGTIPWIQSSDITEHDVNSINPKKFISDRAVNKSATKLVPENSIAIVTRVGVGKLVIMPFSYTTSQDFLSLSKLNSDLPFTAYLLYKKMQDELHSVQGTSIKGITKEELLSKEVMITQIEEQKKIGTYFSELDHLITLHQWKCLIYVKIEIYDKNHRKLTKNSDYF